MLEEKKEEKNAFCQISQALFTDQHTMSKATPCCLEDKNGKTFFTCLICQWHYGCDGATCQPRTFNEAGEIISNGSCVNPNPAAANNRNIPPCRSRGLFKAKTLYEKRQAHFNSDWHKLAHEAACKHESVKQVIEETQELYNRKKRGRDMGNEQKDACHELEEVLKYIPKPSAGTKEALDAPSKKACGIVLPITEPTGAGPLAASPTAWAMVLEQFRRALLQARQKACTDSSSNEGILQDLSTQDEHFAACESGLCAAAEDAHSISRAVTRIALPECEARAAAQARVVLLENQNAKPDDVRKNLRAGMPLAEYLTSETIQPLLLIDEKRAAEAAARKTADQVKMAQLSASEKAKHERLRARYETSAIGHQTFTSTSKGRGDELALVAQAAQGRGSSPLEQQYVEQMRSLKELTKGMTLATQQPQLVAANQQAEIIQMQLVEQQDVQIKELRKQQAEDDERCVELQRELQEKRSRSERNLPHVEEQNDRQRHKKLGETLVRMREAEAKLVAHGDEKALARSDLRLRNAILAAKEKAVYGHPFLKAAEEEAENASKLLPEARKALRLCEEALNAREGDAKAAVKAAQAAQGGADPMLNETARVLGAGDPFDVLGVQRNATDADVKAKYGKSRSIFADGRGELCIQARQRLTDAYERMATLEQRRDLESARVRSAKGPFAVLGLPRNASNADVDKRVKDLASLVHPDKGGDVELMQVVNNAGDDLKDKERKAKYIRSYPIVAGRIERAAKQKDLALSEARCRHHEKMLGGIMLKPLPALLPAKGLETTCSPKPKALNPIVAFACGLTVKKVERIHIIEQLPGDPSEPFRAATIDCTVIIGDEELDVRVPFELATLCKRDGSFHAPSLAEKTARWAMEHLEDIQSTFKELHSQAIAIYDEACWKGLHIHANGHEPVDPLPQTPPLLDFKKWVKRAAAIVSAQAPQASGKRRRDDAEQESVPQLL